jgi:diguanylate cyclase (GGDEF)-like protein/PAS domain S-box-containing protein
MRLSKLRLATHIQVLVAGLVVLGTLLLLFTIDRQQREVTLLHAGNDLGDRIQASATQLRKLTDSLRQDVLFLSKNPPVSGIVRATQNGGIDPRDRNPRAIWVRRLQEIFAAFADANPDYFEIAYVGTAAQGSELVRVERHDGAIVVVPDRDLQAIGERDYLAETLKLATGQVYLSDWHVSNMQLRSANSPRRSLIAATPVRDASGNVFGAVVITLDIGRNVDSLADLLPSLAHAYIADSAGVYLWDFESGHAFAAERSAEARIQVDFPGLARALDAANGRHTVMYPEQTADGIRYVTAERIAFDPLRPERFVLLAFVQRPEAFAAEMDKSRAALLLRGLVICVLLGVAILLVVRRLFRPLRQMADAARDVANGVREVRLPAVAGGELGALAQSFQTMLDRVHAREQDYQRLNEVLEARIDERTKELQLAASVVHSTSEGVVVTDRRGRIISVNPAFTEITRYAAAEVIGKNPRLLKSDHHDAGFYKTLWQMVQLYGRWHGELWNRRKGGEAYLQSLTINMIRGSDGKPQSYVGVFSDVTEARRDDQRMRHLALHDPLTGLPNRFLLNDRIEHAIGVARRESSRLALLFIDLDRFKEVNDRHGHELGDQVLKEIGGRLRSCLRDTDTVARLGGDEFVVLLENVDETDRCAVIAGHLIAAVSQPMEINGRSLPVGASIGAAFFPEDGSSADELMKLADMAMYTAKRDGRGGCRFYSKSMGVEINIAA